MRRPLISMNFFSPNGFAPRLIDILLERFSGLPGRRCISHDEYHVNRGIVLAIAVERRVAAGASMDDGVGHAGASQAVAFLSRSEEHTSELQSLLRNSYAVFCLKQKKTLTDPPSL